MRLLFPFSLMVAPLVLSAAEPSHTSAPVQDVDPRDRRIDYLGRVGFAADGEARLGFPGITIRFVYRGPAPLVKLGAGTDHCYFNLACNGWDPVMIHPPKGRSTFVLPAGEAPAEGWLVELVRRSESWQGVASFHGLSLPAGCELLPPPARPERRLMCIGDSITSGERIDRMAPELDDTPRTANAGRSYGMLLARALGAQVHLVSYGGRGVVRDWAGSTDVANAPQFFDRTLPDDPNSVWNHRDYVPDAVVVCLGTNDFSPGLIEEVVYTAAYDRFLSAVRAAYPATALVLAESPVFDETAGTPGRIKRDLLRRCLDAIVARRRGEGDRRIVVAPLRHMPGGVGDGHPTAFQHEQIAAQILPRVRELTGW
jgi:lysophospholipase L1-like esterase